MKYYEVRCNNLNTRVCLMHHGYINYPEGKVIFEGDFPILKAFEDMGDGFYRPKFDFSESMFGYPLTKKELEQMGFQEGYYNEELTWVVVDSDHRPDVRVIDENMYNKIINNKTSLTVVAYCEHLESDYPESFESKYIIATKAEHQLGDISRMEGDLALVSQKNDKEYCGNWVEGMGFFNVRFPIETSRIVSEEEAKEFIRKREKV